jgi:ribosomal protein L7/L12
MKMNSAYQQAIDILVNNQLDYKAIAVKLAKTNPVVFVAIVDSLSQTVQNQPPVDKCIHNILKYALHMDRPAAIREVRVKYGIGLREAKNIVDNLQKSMAEYQSPGVPFPSIVEALTPYFQGMYQELWNNRQLVGLHNADLVH